MAKIGLPTGKTILRYNHHQPVSTIGSPQAAQNILACLVSISQVLRPTAACWYSNADLVPDPASFDNAKVPKLQIEKNRQNLTL